MASLFKPSTPAPPPVAAPPPLPDLNSPEVMAAKNAASSAVATNAGRAATIMTTPKNRPSGGDYTGSKLG
jgi:hypothetical protein